MDTSMPLGYRNKIVLLVIAVLVLASSFFRIADLDFWWHLKTGQVIWQQKAFQYHEIYSFTANGREYIDHEWLFQVIQYFLYSNWGAAGVIAFKCLLLITIYSLTSSYLFSQKASPEFVLVAVLISICGARPRFIERPELMSALFLIILYLVLDYSFRTNRKKWLFCVPIIVAVWANTHAAVILGIILQFAFFAGLLAERAFKKNGWLTHYECSNTNILTMALLIGISILATGLNPYGFRVLKVPFELTRIINSGILHNQEWQRPSFLNAPMFFVALAFTFVAMVLSIRRFHSVNFLFAIFLAFISLQYVRNIGMFCLFMPLLVAPAAESLSEWRLAIRTALVGSCVALFWTLSHSPFEKGIGQASYFPEKIVEFTQQKNLQGEMLNSYGFGGYLIWRLYP